MSLASRLQFCDPIGRTKVIETHISWVVLTGRYAYKIKKPVNLGFCDFSTLEKRRFYCEEELRLNRRLAPETYLGVVPVTGTSDDPVMEGAGEIIDYAVKMIEFPQEKLLSHLADRKLLTAELIEALAQMFGKFQNEIPIAGLASRFGEAAVIRKAVQEALAHCDADSSLSRWIDDEGGRLEPFFQNRKKHGFIREGHGDAHLGNMFEDQGRVVLFDAIDFNEDLRWIDGVSEIAFTVMDLEHRGLNELAQLFLNLWLEVTGDYEGLKSLAYYKAYRALVRAKVAAIRLSQAGLSKNDREDGRREQESYRTLALKFTKRSTPKLRITFGLSGTGKTYQTRRLLMQEGGIRLRTDVERKRLYGLKAGEKSSAALKTDMYSLEANARVYGRLADLSRLLLSEGYSVIVDGTFLKRTERQVFRTLAVEEDAEYEILAFEASDDVLRERIMRRASQGVDASEADLDVLEMQKKVLEPISDDEQVFVRRVTDA